MKNNQRVLYQVAQIVDSALQLHQAKEQGNPAMQQLAEQEWQQQRNQILENLENNSLTQSLQRYFALDDSMLVLLLLAVLPVWNPSYYNRFGILQDQKKGAVPDFACLLRLVYAGRHEALPSPSANWSQSPLFTWRLLQTGTPFLPFFQRELSPAADLLDFFQGEVSLDPDHPLGLHPIQAPVHEVQVLDSVQVVLDQQVIAFQSQRGLGSRTQAHWLAEQKGQKLYELQQEESLWKSEQAFARLQDLLRFLSLNQAALYWRNGLSALQEHPQAAKIVFEWLQLDEQNHIFFQSESLQPWPASFASLKLGVTSLQPLSLEEGQALWKKLAQHYLHPEFTQVDWQRVVESYPVSPKEMLQVLIQLKQEKPQEINTEQVLKQCLRLSAPAISNLAVRSLPRCQWDQLVLSEETREPLQALEQHFLHRHHLVQSGVFPNLGLSALFWGPPGTGKTMAAEALAQHLHLPLYKADLSNIASKWIGETEKHLSKVFEEAERNRAVLFFDEADAIFTKRTHVKSNQDKNTNMGTSFLLQRLESYEGILILASNFKRNIDEAFFRRLHFCIEFPLPELEQRLELWKQCWVECVSLDEEIDFNQLAQYFPLSGAGIRNIAQHATRAAMLEAQQHTSTWKVKKSHFYQAIRQEYQKMDDLESVDYLLKQWLNQSTLA